MIVKLLTEHHLEFLSLKRDCTGWSESTLVKMTNSWKSHALAHLACEEAYVLRTLGLRITQVNAMGEAHK